MGEFRTAGEGFAGSRPDNSESISPWHAGRCLHFVPEAWPDVLWRADCASGLFLRGAGQPAQVAVRPRLCRPCGALPTPTWPSFQPGGPCAWHDARRLGRGRTVAGAGPLACQANMPASPIDVGFRRRERMRYCRRIYPLPAPTDTPALGRAERHNRSALRPRLRPPAKSRPLRRH